MDQECNRSTPVIFVTCANEAFRCVRLNPIFWMSFISTRIAVKKMNTFEKIFLAFFGYYTMILGIWTLVVFLVTYYVNKEIQYLLIMALFMWLVQKDEGLGIFMGLMFLTIISIVVIDAISFYFVIF